MRNSAVQPVESRDTATSQMPFQFSFRSSNPSKLGVPHRAVRVGPEQEGGPSVVEAVEEQGDVAVHGEVCVAAQLAGPNEGSGLIVGAYANEQGDPRP